MNATAPRTQAQRSAATKDAIITAATRLIADKGFDATGIDDFARAAGVSKGALYHHYSDKVEVLVAVYERLEQQLSARLVAAAAAATDPVAALRLGCHAFLDACLDPMVRRIALVEAPAGLGWERWRAIDGRYGFGLLRAGLEAAAQQGQITVEHLDERAHMLLAVLIEASLLLGTSPNPSAIRAVVGTVVDDLLDALTCAPGRSAPRGP